MTRRQALRLASNGFGWLAASSLLGQQPLHHSAKAKRVVFFFMPGGVSHMESFDPKPKLAELDGKPSKLDFYMAGPGRKWLRPLWEFKQQGQCGTPVSSLFPNISRHIDDLAIIRSMKSDFPLHARGTSLLHTGKNAADIPASARGSTTASAAENANLPGFVLLRFGAVPPGGLENFSNGFLPASHQATLIAGRRHTDRQYRPAPTKTPVSSGPSSTRSCSRTAEFLEASGGHDASNRQSPTTRWPTGCSRSSPTCSISTKRIRSHAAALWHRLDDMPETPLRHPVPAARRLIESGVRFVEITCPPAATNGTWDQHGDLKKRPREERPRSPIRPIAGLSRT